MKLKLKSLLVLVLTILILVTNVCQSTVSYAWGEDAANNTYGETARGLNAEQRKAFVAFVVDFIEQGNQKFLLRYTQGAERTCSYSWTTVDKSVKQKTPETVILKREHAQNLEAMLNANITDESKKIKITNYVYEKCTILGADIKGAIGTDCSSFGSSMYHLVVGSTFQYNSTGFNDDKANLFDSSSDMSSAQPGDILWQKRSYWNIFR